MSLKTIRKAFLYCTIINYFLLIVWFLILVSPHDWLYHFSSFGASKGDWDRINLNALVISKALVIIFNLVPCIALYLVKVPDGDR